MKRLCCQFLFCVSFLTIAIACPAQNKPQIPDDTIKITTKLVQIDAVVVDKNGNPVSDLKAGDFDLRQDGKPQKVTHAIYVDSTSPNAGKSAVINQTAEIESVSAKKSGSTGRVIAFVVDDGNCASSFETVRATKVAIEKFINTMMLPNDRVAIYRTRADTSVLQQYTSDKLRLLDAVRAIKWRLSLRKCIQSEMADSGESADEQKIRENAEEFVNGNELSGSLAVTNYAIRGLQSSGGRKILFFMSPGFLIIGKQGARLPAWYLIRGLAETANRAGVVINSIDSRGLLNTLVIDAESTIEIGDRNGYQRSMFMASGAANDLIHSRYGMDDLSYLTGGQLLYNLNDLSDHIERVLRTEKGYYLLAYEPDDETFRGKNFNKIEIKVKRPDLKVIARPGFVGIPDKEKVKVKQTENSDLYEAIVAPLTRTGLNLQMTAFSGNSREDGSYVRALIHLSGDELTFADDAGGMKKTSIDVVAVTLDEQNQIVDEFTRGHTFKISADAIPTIRQNGLTYVTDVPVKKAGSYNFRVAVRDNASKNIGTSSQIVEIPDMSRGRFFMSGLTTSAVDKNGKFVVPGRVKPENAIAVTTTIGSPATRQYHKGEVIAYSYSVYNAQTDKTTGKPNVSVQIKLYRDGQLVIDGKPETATPENQPDWSRFIDFGYLRLNSAVESGDYTLQVIVRDFNPAAKNAAYSQSIDFQILP